MFLLCHQGGASSKERNAFFALRSCHQILRGDSGEFFSPDYLCSNPPLWCNWTIQAPPGKHVHLQLEDFTPADACHLKTDQIHVDESPGPGTGAGGGLAPAMTGDHRILEKCWKKAEYTSYSGTVHVVLLISRTPNPPLRGFYGHFKALGGPSGTIRPPKDGADVEGLPEKPESSDVHQNRSPTELPVLNPRSKAKSPRDSGKADTGFPPDHVHSPKTVDRHFVSPAPTSMATEHPSLLGYVEGDRAERATVTWKTVRGHSETGVSGGGRGGERGGDEDKTGEVLTPDTSSTKAGKKTPLLHADEPSTATAAQDTESGSKVTTQVQSRWRQSEKEQDEYLTVTQSGYSPVTHTMTTAQRHLVEEQHGFTSVSQTKVEAARKPGTETNLKERAVSHQTQNNGTHHLHLPGASLFEVSLEVAFSHQAGENWDQLVTPLLSTAKKMIKEELVRYAPTTISSKRIKRLSSGALFLLWVHFGEGQDGAHTHGVLHAAAEGLRGRSLLLQGGGTEGVITYISVTDVNECGTQLAQCDAHAECVNRFGTYVCRCRPGYLDKSLSGPGGTICIDLATTGCAWSSPTLLKGVYCVCFLLSFLIAVLLFSLVAMYRRHHQGAFMLHCQSRCPSHVSVLGAVTSPPGSCDNDGDASGRKSGCLSLNRPLPPPPPPPVSRRPKDGGGGSRGGKAPDPSLLHFGPLTRTEESGENGPSETGPNSCTV
ncbi:hypothetical protein ACEWY4_017555 [Coilia grayii]|uniref:EGF-like domain-containing protein n=1 Tax=Coilia grayii TaxID=363190 RepID=A0ABD1JK30_9TELE